MIFNSANILHIDDERSVLKSTEMILEPKNYSIMGVTNANEGIELLKKNYFDYDLIFLDLEMPEMDGIETFIAIRKINPKIPILFVSAHFGEAKWERKLRNLEIEIKRIDKPFPIVTSKDFLDIENTLYVERNRYREELLKPFKYSLAEFMNLSDNQMDELFEEAYEVNSKFVEHYFDQNPDKDWISIAKEPGNIVVSGISEDEPFEEDLMKLAKKYNAPVFTYSRSKIIEQVGIKFVSKKFW